MKNNVSIVAIYLLLCSCWSANTSKNKGGQATDTLVCSQSDSRKDSIVGAPKNTLPFNLNDYFLWSDAYYSEIPDPYTDTLSYFTFYIDATPHLKKSYLEKWQNDTIPLRVFEFDIRKNFELYVYVCTLNNDTPSMIYRVVTMRNNEVIDGLTAYTFILEIDGENNSFIISKDLKVTFLKCVFRESGHVKSSSVLKEFQIDDNGKINKL